MRSIRTKEKEQRLVRGLLSTECSEIIKTPYISRYLGEIKDCSEELYSHSVNVAIITMIIGMEVYNNKKDEIELFSSALLHDYGKLSIPKRILDKEDILTRSERYEMERHPLCGYESLRQDKNLSKNVLMGIMEHHERINGTGYGRGKHEGDISDFAKIIMIADVYDAMISDRVYKKKIDRSLVYEYIFSNAGILFSRSEVKCFINTTVPLDLDYVISETNKNIFGNSKEKLVIGS